MAVLPIHPVDHPLLRRKSSRLRSVSDDVRDLIVDMFETMDHRNGIGLAANQIGRPWRLIVVSAGDDRLAIVNPEVVKAGGTQVGDEGCLSLPNWYGPVERATQVTVKGLDERGRKLRRRVTGLAARAVLHEIDHLDGVIFTDRLTDDSKLRFVDPREAHAKGLHAS